MAKQLLGIALTADSEAVKLSAIKDALDRGGLKAPSEVVLSQGEPKPYEQVFDGITESARAESRRSRGIPDSGDNAFAGKSAGAGTSPATAYADEADPHAMSDYASGAADGVSAADTAEDDAPYADMPPQRVRRVRTQHITGDEALAIAAALRRDQLALESPHKRYPRP
jgi:hypothetical protein